MLFRQLFDPATSTYTYLLADTSLKQAVLIDPVREQLQRDIQLLRELELELRFVLETHVHADHVTSAGELRAVFGAKTVWSVDSGVACADRYVQQGDRIQFGEIDIEVRQTPGHTDGCLTFVVPAAKMAFTGDALLIRGCGRTDFQQGSAARLYRSVYEQIFSLPDDTLLYPAHDYQGRMVTSVAEEKAYNARLRIGRTEAEFIETMSNLKLPYPKRIDEALPLNLRCGLAVQEATASEDPSWVVTRSPMGAPEVTLERARAAIEAKGVRVIDVREPHELEGDLPMLSEADHVPLGDLGKRAVDWNRDQTYLLVCRSGNRSQRAALEMEQLGFKRVASMVGGMTAWHNAYTHAEQKVTPAPECGA